MGRDNVRSEAFAAHRSGDLATAERLYHELLGSTPRDAEVLHYLGVLCHQGARPAESARWLRQAVELAPGALPTLQLLIRVSMETADAAGALDALDRYLALRPGDAGMLNIKGQQLVRLGRLHDAEPAFRQAAEQGGKAALYHDLGLCRQWRGDKAGAAVAYEEAIRRGHNQPMTHLSLAQCLRATGRTQDYFEVATHAARSFPGDIGLLIEAQSARRYVCDWDGFQADQPQLRTRLSQVLKTGSGPDIPPGVLNYLEVGEDLIAAVAKRHAGGLAAGGEALRRQLRRPEARGRKDRIRLGYLSTDFFAHAVGFLVRDLFACHDRDRFEVYGYSLRHQPDAVQTRIQQGCDHYRNLTGSSAGEIAQAIVDDRIDILIDLAGYTSAAQPTVLAARPAPVQIAWIGYLGTGGSDFIDYLIADDIALPAEVASNYTEQIIRLPQFFLPASPLPVATSRPSRQDLGCSEEDIVFCSFNQPYKLDRPTFRAWMEILRRVPQGKLWLYTPDTRVCGANLQQQAMRQNVDPDRLIFAPRMPMAEHVARLSLADLALDPFHISGGATSVAAVAAGVPVLTQRGDSFLARMGSSLNAHLGLDELDCIGPEDYVAKAVALATAPLELAAVRSRLDSALQTHGFFNTATFTGLLEEALLAVWGRYEAGLPAVDIRIAEAGRA